MGAGCGIKPEQILWSLCSLISKISLPLHPTPPHILRLEDWRPDLLWLPILRLRKHQASLGDISWGTWGADKVLDEPNKALNEG